MSTLLETKRLIIRSPRIEDFDDMYMLQSNADVMKYIGRGVRTKAEVMSGLEKAIAHQHKYNFSLGSVFEKETQHFIGRAGLIHLAYDDTQPNIEIGYALIKSAWNKGYATELAKALIEWGFQHLRVEKLLGTTLPDNKASQRVLEKVGMTYSKNIIYPYANVEAFLYEIQRNLFNNKQP